MHENFALRFAASGSAGNLREQLKGPLARAEIRHMQRQICVDDPNQSYIWKVQTLGDHLRSDEDVDLAGTKVPQRFAVSFLSRH